MASIQGIYIALFGRPADPGGLAYFNSVTKNGADLSGIGDLTKTAEYVSRFTNMTNEQIVNSIYQSLFGRAGDKDGVDFFLAKLASGQLNINNIAIAIFDGAQGDDLSTVKAKVAAADLFTSHLDLQSEIDAYKGNNAAQIGRDFITAVNKDNPGTAEKADSAIVKTVQNQGQAPGDDAGAGGGGGSTTTPTTFEIHKSVPPSDNTTKFFPVESSISFDGNATGKITLGQTGGIDMSVAKMAAPVELPELAPTFDLTPRVSLLTGERGGVAATFPDGPVQTFMGNVNIAHGALPADLVLKELHVSMDAETASTHEISGQGSVTISGSGGDQEIHVTTSGNNKIEGGLGADTIDITSDKVSGADVVKINGPDSEVSKAIANASGAREILEDMQSETELQDAKEHASEDATAASKLVDDRNKLLNDAADARKDADAANTLLSDANAELTKAIDAGDAAKSALDNATKAYNDANKLTDLAVGVLDGQITIAFTAPIWNTTTISRVTNFIENSKELPPALKAILIKDIPTKQQDFNSPSELAKYIKKINSDIAAYKSQTKTDKADAENAKDAADKALVVATAKEDAAQKVFDPLDKAASKLEAQLDEARKETSDEALNAQKETADSAMADAIKAIDIREKAATDLKSAENELVKFKIQTDSQIGSEDKISGFDAQKDHLELPKGEMVKGAGQASFTIGEHTYSVDFKNDIGHLTENLDGKSVGVTLSGDLLKAALNYLSDDHIVKQGQTVAFDYEDGNEKGLYVFQGGDYGSDIGVKLVDIHTSDDGINLAQILGIMPQQVPITA